ncbi:lipid A ABC transporter ATP-binding protein/permease MsbA [Dyella jejuensis]
MIVDASCMTLFAKLIRPLLDRLFIDKNPSMIFWMPIWIIGIFVLRSFASFASDYAMAYVGRGVVYAMRNDVFRAYLYTRVDVCTAEGNGMQIARITYTCEQVAQAATDAVKTVLIDGMTTIGLVAVMIYYSPELALALLVMVPSIALIATRVSLSYRKISQRLQIAMGGVTAIVSSAVTSFREIKTYGAQSYEKKRFYEISERTQRLNLKVIATNALATSLVQCVAACALALLIFLATQPALLDSVTPGTFFAVLMAMGGILPSLKHLTGVQSNVQRGVVAAEDLFAAIDVPAEPDHGKQVARKVRGELHFKHVQFTYPNVPMAALSDITLHCKPGTMTALVGRSGSGKSTLSSLLPRFHDPSKGSITLDGIELRDYTLASLRQQMAWVGQSVVLFDDTVAANIAYGELSGASEAAIRDAADAANALAFIERLPHGLHTRIGQDGELLSGGQRQRIAIARAILKDAPILIMDEATSALDVESERLIQDALLRLMRNRTTLVIAHRLSTIQHADHIVMLDQGRIIEHGTHTELLDAGGAYAMLYRLQFS